MFCPDLILAKSAMRKIFVQSNPEPKSDEGFIMKQISLTNKTNILTCQVDPRGTKWSQVGLSLAKSTQVGPSGHNWRKMEPSAATWSQV